jgi:hypothetical protein
LLQFNCDNVLDWDKHRHLGDDSAFAASLRRSRV